MRTSIREFAEWLRQGHVTTLKEPKHRGRTANNLPVIVSGDVARILRQRNIPVHWGEEGAEVSVKASIQMDEPSLRGHAKTGIPVSVGARFGMMYSAWLLGHRSDDIKTGLAVIVKKYNLPLDLGETSEPKAIEPVDLSDEAIDSFIHELVA